jgi:thiamine-monophosphate kinase
MVRCVNLKLRFPQTGPFASPSIPVYNLQFAAFHLTLSADAATTVRKFSMNNEDQLVERTVRAIPSISAQRRFRGVPIGIGDDAAVLSPNGHTDWVLSCDGFFENVHFLAKIHPPDSVGYKALVRAASDLVAMGASPRYFLLTLALPASRTTSWLDGFARGMARAARYLGMRLIGGDTTQSKSIAISITVLGEIARGRALTRSGARPGDIIYVSGKLGRAQLGLDLVLSDFSRRRAYQELLRPHLYPEIRVKLGEWLARNKIASAMMDISDGLSTDLGRLCAASRGGARIEASRVPRGAIPASLAHALKNRKLNSLQMALHGGDDYELLFTVPPRHLKRFRSAPEFSDCTAIGEITRGRRILLVGDDGKASTLEARGWDSFRKK